MTATPLGRNWNSRAPKPTRFSEPFQMVLTRLPAAGTGLTGLTGLTGFTGAGLVTGPVAGPVTTPLPPRGRSIFGWTAGWTLLTAPAARPCHSGRDCWNFS